MQVADKQRLLTSVFLQMQAQKDLPGVRIDPRGPQAMAASESRNKATAWVELCAVCAV